MNVTLFNVKYSREAMCILASQNCSADIIMICSVQQSKTVDKEITLNPESVTVPSFLMLSHDNLKHGAFFIFVFDITVLGNLKLHL